MALIDQLHAQLTPEQNALPDAYRGLGDHAGSDFFYQTSADGFRLGGLLALEIQAGRKPEEWNGARRPR